MGKILRRSFLIGGVALGGGLLVGGYMLSREWDNPLLAEGALPDGDHPFTPFVSVSPAGEVTAFVPRAEMGQGVQTTLAAMVAEEMGLDLADLRVEHGPASGAYYNSAMLAEGGPFAFYNDRLVAKAARSVFGAAGFALGLQVTGGSSSVRDAFVKMRVAAATARQALAEVAAERAGVPVADLLAEKGGFRHEPTGAVIPFADVVVEAAARPLPDAPKLRDRSEWRVLGRSQPRVDTLAKVTGAPIYGIDVDLPDMLHATVAISPVFGGHPVSSNAAEIEAMPGIERVVEIDGQAGSGFAFVARDTWSAFRAAEALEAEWTKPEYLASTELIDQWTEDALGEGAGSALLDDGDVDAALAAAGEENILEARYDVPHLAHMTMEPMNATALFADGRLTLWLGTQAPTIVKGKCAETVGIDPKMVSVNTTHLGGGFGRRGEFDFASYAAIVAKAVEGRPVKVTWRREEDTTHDTYRPAAKAHYRAALDADGRLAALDARIAVPSIIQNVLKRTYPSLPAAGPDRLMTEGAFDQPYAVPAIRVTGVKAPQALPIGFWRSVGYSHNAFFHESFIDECAHRARIDPLEYRLALAEPWPAATNAIRTVAEMAEWGTGQLGRAKGLAFSLSFGTWVAQVIEVENRDGEIAVTRGWCAAEIGEALDPAIIAAQMRGGMIYGLSAAIGQSVTVEDGRVVETNFGEIDALRIGQAPRIEVKVLETHEAMGGAGEPGLPSAAPALANAVFALTGERVRSLPLDRSVSFVGW